MADTRRSITYIEVTHGHRATIATIQHTTVHGGDVIQATGEALRHPEDKYDRELAYALATGRAFESLGRKLQKRADGLVRMNEHNQEASRKAKLRKLDRARNQERVSVS